MRRRAGDFEAGGDIAAAFWRAEHDAGVVRAAAMPASCSGDDAFDLASLPAAAFVWRRAACEELVIGDAVRSIRVEIVEGSLLAGPVLLDWRLAGLAALDPKLATLRRLAALIRLRRMPVSLFPAEPKARRWADAFKAHDARVAGASQRDIAILIFGRARVDADWREGGHMRMRVQRLLRTADELIAGGWRRLLL